MYTMYTNGGLKTTIQTAFSKFLNRIRAFFGGSKTQGDVSIRGYACWAMLYRYAVENGLVQGAT